MVLEEKYVSDWTKKFLFFFVAEKENFASKRIVVFAERFGQLNGVTRESLLCFVFSDAKYAIEKYHRTEFNGR